jgi:hypothetical protein
MLIGELLLTLNVGAYLDGQGLVMRLVISQL